MRLLLFFDLQGVEVTALEGTISQEISDLLYKA